MAPTALSGAMTLGAGTIAATAGLLALALGPTIALSVAATKNWGKSSDEVMKERYKDETGDKIAKIIADEQKKSEQLKQKRREREERRQQQVDVNVHVDVEQEKGLKADCRTEVNSASKHFGALEDFYRKNNI